MKRLLDNVRLGASVGTAILKARVLGEYIPFHVQISVTDRCNLRCSYCYGNFALRGKPELSTDEWFRIIDELASMGTKAVSLVGGEPLIRDDIGCIITHVKSKGMECSITSNGYYVKRKIEEVKKLDLLCISLDGEKEANDANRGAGSYESAMEAIQTARENDITLHVATVLTKNNLHSIDYILNEARKYGFMVKFVPLGRQSLNGQDISHNNFPTDEEYREVFRHLIEMKEKGYPVFFSRESLQYALDWRPGYEKAKIIGEKPDFPYIKCYAGKYFAAIDTDGCIYPCFSLFGEIKVLNSLEVGVEKAFAQINNHKCHTCPSPCGNDFSLMYSLHVGVLLNWLLNYRKPH